MANVVPLFDPDGPLRGKAREVAMARYREVVAEIVERSIGEAFTACCRLQQGEDLCVNDAVSIIVESCRDVLDRYPASAWP